MKLVTYTTGTKARLGAVRDDQVVDLAEASQGRLPADMLTFLEHGQGAMDLAREVLASAAHTLPLAQVKLLAPLPNPPKIVAVGLNYMDHCREQDLTPPTSPVLFAKFSTAVIGPEAQIRWDPALTQQVDYEAELAVVMGRRARRVPASQAYDHVAGYTIINDVSARDLQFSDGQWIRAKSLDTFCPMGPWLVTRDEVPDPHRLPISCLLNGELVQNSNTDEIIFKTPELIAFISRAFTLLPGDVISTGTTGGVGVFRDPQCFMRDGDVVTVRVEGLGALTNYCREEATL